MSRKYVDCRDYPSEMNCSLRISGEEEEVVRAATEHAVSVHGHRDTPEFRSQIRQTLQDESEAAVPRRTGATGASKGARSHTGSTLR